MATVIDEVATFVATACGMTVGTNVFKGHMPDKPDVAACVYEYGGAAPGFVLGQTAPALEHPRVQIVFRATPRDYSTAREAAETAFQACAEASNTTLSGTRYTELLPLQSPFKISEDSNERPVVGFNVAIGKVLS